MVFKTKVLLEPSIRQRFIEFLGQLNSFHLSFMNYRFTILSIVNILHTNQTKENKYEEIYIKFLNHKLHLPNGTISFWNCYR